MAGTILLLGGGRAGNREFLDLGSETDRNTIARRLEGLAPSAFTLTRSTTPVSRGDGGPKRGPPSRPAQPRLKQASLNSNASADRKCAQTKRDNSRLKLIIISLDSRELFLNQV